MQPDDTSLINILSSSPMQYVIPRFQREYTWGKDSKLIRVKQLWEDIKQAHSTQRPHFTGTIVFTVDNYGNDTCQCRYLIDGQQRMITTSLMIKAFSLHVSSKDTKKVIDSYLVNVVDSVYGSNLKILPSEDDRKAYKAIINNKGSVAEIHLKTPVGKAYSFFEKQLSAMESNPEPYTIDELYNSAVKFIHVVRIVIDNQEDPSEIFKSLNDNSSPLSKLDLIRNHILMKLKVDSDKKDWQKHFYDNCWHPFEELLSELDPNKRPEKVFEDFMRCYFIKNGKKVSYSMIYETMKDKIKELVSKSTDSGVVIQEKLYNSFEDFISELNDDFSNYRVIYGYQKKKVGKQNTLIIRQCMYQLSSLGVKTHSSYVLKLLSEFDKGTIDEDELTSCIRMVDSYFIRRSIRGGLSYNSVEKMFFDLCSNTVVKPGELYNELTKYPGDSRVWPNDVYIKDRLKEDLYDPNTKNTLVLILLQQLDMKIAGRWVDYPSETQIEHICPQNRSDDWANHYSKDDYESMFKMRHCLGNLTLSDYNQLHGQKLYSEKKMEYAEKVTCCITRRVANIFDDWTLSTFNERSGELIDDFLDEWPYEYQSFLSKPKKKKSDKRN